MVQEHLRRYCSGATITGAGVRDFGHLAYRVDDIYDGRPRVTDRPLRDSHMTLVRSPDGGISIELLQKDDAPPLKEPWGIHG